MGLSTYVLLSMVEHFFLTESPFHHMNQFCTVKLRKNNRRHGFWNFVLKKKVSTESKKTSISHKLIFRQHYHHTQNFSLLCKVFIFDSRFSFAQCVSYLWKWCTYFLLIICPFPKTNKNSINKLVISKMHSFHSFSFWVNFLKNFILLQMDLKTWNL